MVLTLPTKSPLPGFGKGAYFLYIWPTLEHGASTIWPPHCQILKLSSYCSPPQISKPSSYPPSSQKNLLLMANNPPAMTGLLENKECLTLNDRFNLEKETLLKAPPQ